jgi:hypothetical protein
LRSQGTIENKDAGWVAGILVGAEPGGFGAGKKIEVEMRQMSGHGLVCDSMFRLF